MEIIETRIEPAKGKAIKRLSEETYSLGATLLNGETKVDFEEIDIEKALEINEEYNRKNNPEEYEIN